MDFSIKACDWTKGSSNGFLTGKSDCIVIGVFESQTLSGAAQNLQYTVCRLSGNAQFSKVGDLLNAKDVLGTGLLDRISPKPFAEEQQMASELEEIDLPAADASPVQPPLEGAQAS